MELKVSPGALFLYDFMVRFPQLNPDARFRVDTRTGYASYSAMDYERALDVFENGGIRLRVCKNIYDDGAVVMGEPLPEE